MLDTNAENLGRLMSDVYIELDVPPEKLKEANCKYESLGKWLKADAAIAFNSNSNLYPQGSVLYGTLVRPLNGGEYDFDFVYRRELVKENITQDELKKQVGDQLRRYIAYLKQMGETDIPELIPRARCWRLQFKGKFHMDILPAIPDENRDYLMWPEEGLLITDKTLTRWQFSNPKGYHAWLKQRMNAALFEARAAIAKSAQVDVEKIPESSAKTTLQQLVQILKRHRDAAYEGHPDDKPISVIITTLAAHAYNNSSNLYLALRDVLNNMHRFIDNRNGILWVENPINKRENFADKWNANPIRAKHFYAWLEQATADFEAIALETNEMVLAERLQKSLRLDSSRAVAAASRKRAGLAAAASAVKVNTDPWIR